MTLSQAEVERRIQAFIQTCRRQGMKITQQRREIFRELAAGTEHPDAETVYESVCRRVPSISRDTIYRTLATLEVEGLIRKVSPLVEKARYDANPDRHHHFICTVCGMVRDFYSEDLDDLPIPPAVKTFGEMESAQVEVRGVCSPCASRRRKTRRRRSV